MGPRALGIFLVILLAHAGISAPGMQCVNPSSPPNLFRSSVIKVVDGDTADVRLIGGLRERVRFLGIDTPEVFAGSKLDRDSRESGRPKEVIQALGRLASDFTKRHLRNKEVRLEFDVQTRDQYGRLLAYLWLDDGTLFNMLILREGYAQVLTIPPNVKYSALFLACQREARNAVRGLWKP